MSESAVEVERALLAFIVEELLEEGLYEGGDPLATEALDSLGLEQLIDYIESRWGVPIDDGELLKKNFESLPALATFVNSRRNGGRG